MQRGALRRILYLDQTSAVLHARGATPLPFARSCAVAPFVGFLDALGAPTDKLLHQARVPIGLLHDPEGLVPIFPVYRFIELAARKEYLEGIGTVVGQRASAFELGAYGMALQTAATLYDYLTIGIRLIGELSSGTRFWMGADGNVVRVNQYLKGPPGIGRCIADVYTLTLTINMLRQFIGADWNPGEVRLSVGDDA